MADIIDRIKKLLKLAENAGSENEAALAADRARELMHQHNISEAELRLNGASEPRAAEEIIRGQVTDTSKKVAWQMAIAGAVDEQYGCHAYWNGGRIMFFGRISAVQAATYTTQYLMREVERLCDAQAPSSEYSRKYRNGFRLGCARRIGARIREQVEERKARERGEVTAESITREQIEELRAIVADDDAPKKIAGVPRDELLQICTSALRPDANKTPNITNACRAAIAEVVNKRAAVANIFDDVLPPTQPKASDGVLMLLKKEQEHVDDAYADFMYGPKNPKSGKRRRRGGGVRIGTVSSHDGYTAGKQAGNSVSIGMARGSLKRGTEVLP